MHLHQNDSKLTWLEFQNLSSFPNIVHASFTRLFGASQGNFASLNISETVGDDLQAVLENRQSVISHFQQSSKNHPLSYIEMNQLHGKEIFIVTSNQPLETAPSCDALITQCKNVILTVKHADCQPIFLYDPIHQAIAAIHAGWKGIAQKITTDVINTMSKTYGTLPETLIAAIGPSIGPNDCEFKGWKEELPSFLYRYINPDSLKLDLWAASLDELQAAGVPQNQIECACLSTYSLTPLFFSYRQSKSTGRNASCIMLI